MLQNTGYLARVLNVVWPALHIDNYLPAAVAPSESRTVSPEASDCEGPAARSGTQRGRTDSLDSEEMDVVVGPMPAAVVAATGSSSGGAVSPVVTPPHSGSAPTSPVAAPTTAAVAAAGQEAHPPSPLSSPEISIHSVPAPIAQPSSPGISSIRADPQPQPVSRPIDGLLFLRELFAMSKFLQLEKRYVQSILQYSLLYYCCMFVVLYISMWVLLSFLGFITILLPKYLDLFVFSCIFSFLFIINSFFSLLFILQSGIVSSVL